MGGDHPELPDPASDARATRSRSSSPGSSTRSRRQRCTPSASRSGLTPSQGLLGQYLTYLDQLFHGNLGVSVTYFPAPSATVCDPPCPGPSPWSASPPSSASLFGTLLGIALRLATRVNAGWTACCRSLPSCPRCRTSGSAWWCSRSSPSTLALVPDRGRLRGSLTPSWSWAFISSALVHGILPAATIVVSSIAGWLLGMRNVMISTLCEDYVLLAEAKGLRQRRVLVHLRGPQRHLAERRQLRALAWLHRGRRDPDRGRLLLPRHRLCLFQAVSNNDYPLMQGVFLIITFLVLLANLLADVCYVVLDPRTRESGR